MCVLTSIFCSSLSFCGHWFCIAQDEVYYSRPCAHIFSHAPWPRENLFADISLAFWSVFGSWQVPQTFRQSIVKFINISFVFVYFGSEGVFRVCSLQLLIVANRLVRFLSSLSSSAVYKNCSSCLNNKETDFSPIKKNKSVIKFHK